MKFFSRVFAEWKLKEFGEMTQYFGNAGFCMQHNSQGSQMRDTVHGTKKHLSWRRTDSITNVFSYEMISLKIICLLLTISQNRGWIEQKENFYLLIVEIEWSLLIRIELSWLYWTRYLFGLLLPGTHVRHDDCSGGEEKLGGEGCCSVSAVQSAALVTTNTAHTPHMAPRVTLAPSTPRWSG